jgi:hypothetical protein
MAEFVGNNAPSESTTVTPFFANYGQHPRMGFEPRSDLPRPALQAVQADEADKFADKMSELQTLLREEMTWAQATQQEYANRKRTPAPAYRVGDKVFIATTKIATTRPSKKLDWKKIGPYPIVEIISAHAYRVSLPDTVKIHDVLPVSRLFPAPPEDIALPGQHNPPPPPVEVDGETEYSIEEILDSRFNKRRRRFEYYVKWIGYPDPTWEPADNLDEVAATDDYHTRYPLRPKPDSYHLDPTT